MKEADDLPGAIRALEDLVAELNTSVGPDHPAALMARIRIAAWRGIAGEHAVAVQELDTLVADMRRVGGDDHPAGNRP